MKPHSLFKLTQKLYGVPHLISQQSFDTITGYLSSRNMGVVEPPMNSPDEQPTGEHADLDDLSGVGVIEICGPLTYKSTGWEAMCGGCSYESILEQAEKLLHDGASCILLVVDSGGGEAYGAFECGEQLRKMCDGAGASLISYIDGCCCSAAYSIACVADEIVCNPFGEAGSIGVLIALYDVSKAMEMKGVKPVFVSAGKQKIPYDEKGAFRKEFLSDLQDKVDSLYDSFCEHVSKFTGLSVADVKATEARCYMAEDALSKGLVNKIMSNAEFVDYIVTKQQGAMNNA